MFVDVVCWFVVAVVYASVQFVAGALFVLVAVDHLRIQVVVVVVVVCLFVCCLFVLLLRLFVRRWCGCCCCCCFC